MAHATNGNAAVKSAPPSFWRQAALLLACALGIYATFLGYGILQERMYTHEYGVKKERFNHSLFLVFFQCIGNAAFALALGLFSRSPSKAAASAAPAPPATAYFFMSASYIGAMFSSNLALGYMSYPAQALAKSCKLIPVMLSRFVLMRGDVRYSRREVLQVIAITAGIGVFMMGAEGSGHGKKERETSWLGLGLCILSLALDGYTGPAQERLNKTHPQLSMATMMFYLNAWAILLVAVALMFTGQMMPGLQFCMDNPSILSEAALFSLCASSGQALILYTLLQFNSLVVVTVTTTRKFFTILLSVVLYGHALAGAQWAGVALVFAGLSLDIYAKYADRGKHGHKHAGKGQDAGKATSHTVDATPISAHSAAAAAPAAVAAPAASSGKKKKPSRKAD